MTVRFTKLTVIDRSKNRSMTGPLNNGTVRALNERTGQTNGTVRALNERTGQTNGTVTAKKRKPPTLTPNRTDFKYMPSSVAEGKPA